MHSQISNLLVSLLNLILFLGFSNYGFYIYKPILASEVLRPRGVSVAMSPFYDASQPFSCFDGSGTVPFHHVNDDFCDCKDGSDEPGTSACLNGVFHCNNLGHVGKDISSSFINDGVCDCCDTSDEYLSNVDCLDVCLHLGEAARAEARHKAEVQLEGYHKRQKMAEEGMNLKKEKQARIVEFTKEKERADLEQAEKLALKNAAEEPEMAALEQYKAIEKEMKAMKEKEENEREKNDAQEAFIHLDANGDEILTIEEIQSSDIFDTATEEEIKFFLQEQESLDLETFLSSTWKLMKPTYIQKKVFIPPTTETTTEESFALDEEEIPPPAVESDDAEDKQYDNDMEPQDEDLEEGSEDYADELDDVELAQEKEESQNEEEEEKERIEYDPETQRMIEIANAAREEFKKADDRVRELAKEIQNLQEVANAAREEFKKADDRVRELAKEIQNLQEGLLKDLGPNQEFRTLEGHCFQYTDREYTYELCPFNKASQRPKDGHGDTRLGSWGEWTGPAGYPYSSMKYTGGQACWNGPQRSAEVRLSCGIENELTAVTEPSRCEYLFLFTTPAVCSQPEHTSDTSMHQHTEL